MRPKLALAMAAALVLAATAPAVAHGSPDEQPLPGVNVEYTDDAVVVHYDVDGNATLTIEAVNGSYAGEGTYHLAGEGKLTLPVPDEPVTVEVTLTYRDHTWSRTIHLDPDEFPPHDHPSDDRRDDRSDGDLHVSMSYSTGEPVVVEYDAPSNTTLTVEAVNGSYAGEGTYDISGEGELTLPEPNGTVTLNVTVSSPHGTWSHEVTLYVDGDWEHEFGDSEHRDGDGRQASADSRASNAEAADNVPQRVRELLQRLLGDYAAGIVASFT